MDFFKIWGKNLGQKSSKIILDKKNDLIYWGFFKKL
jgi:hypothetical protein